jgi:hypothetical protein
MKTVHVFLIVATVSLFSCATYRLLPQEDLDNTIKYTRGTQVLYALKDQIGVAITSEVNVDRIYFQLVVRNFRDSSLYLDDSSVKLSEIDATEAAPVDLKVYRADEYYQLRRKQIVTAQVLMAVSAAMSTANAGNSTSYTRGNYSETTITEVTAPILRQRTPMTQQRLQWSGRSPSQMSGITSTAQMPNLTTFITHCFILLTLIAMPSILGSS